MTLADMHDETWQDEPIDCVETRARRRVGMNLPGGYSLERLVGSGGSGAFYLATDKAQNHIGVKMLHTTRHANPHAARRLAREFEAMRRIAHCGLARVHHLGLAHDDRPFLVMDFFQGETLESLRMRHGGRLSLHEALRIGHDVAEILEVVHAAGIIHRDIKPRNILVTSNGTKLIDFDIAHVPRLSRRAADEMRGFCGTLQFASPEQARGAWHQVDARSDVFSLGATLSLLLTGQPLHEASDWAELFQRAQYVPACSVRTRAPNLPSPVLDVLDAMLAFERQQRPADARTLRQMFAVALASTPR